jgi:hypothetical protein
LANEVVSLIEKYCNEKLAWNNQERQSTISKTTEENNNNIKEVWFYI